ncbi:hypothetical protein T492DRAFT_35492 [Pavlovales sp. CCMP2436]|nr:hypothetical protein T492DRAFT_35492 [Pavlovales sp. CCMP2436]
MCKRYWKESDIFQASTSRMPSLLLSSVPRISLLFSTPSGLKDPPHAGKAHAAARPPRRGRHGRRHRISARVCHICFPTRKRLMTLSDVGGSSAMHLVRTLCNYLLRLKLRQPAALLGKRHHHHRSSIRLSNLPTRRYPAGRHKTRRRRDGKVGGAGHCKQQAMHVDLVFLIYVG